jgi:hypothetical protein
MRSKKNSTILVAQPSYLHSIVRSLAQVTAFLFTEPDREATWGGKAAKIVFFPLRLGLGLLGLHVAGA